MPSCAVKSCSNSHRKQNKISPVTGKPIKFHRMPTKNEEIRKKWIEACGREVKDRSAVVCVDHFQPEDYERNLKAELLGIPFIPRLKPDVVPSLHLTRITATTAQKRKGGRSPPKGGTKNKAGGKRGKESAKVGGLVKKESSDDIHSEKSDSTNDSNIAATVPSPASAETILKPNNPPDRDKPATSFLVALIPDKTNCLICFANCSKSTKDPLDDSESPSLLSKHLTNIFILRQILELPLSEVEKYLSCCPNPDEWIGICDKCTEFVKDCQNIYNNLLEICCKFDKAKLELIQMMKRSIAKDKRSLTSRWPSITDASRRFVNSRNYDDLDQPSNPFVEGDKIADELEALRNKGKRSSIRLHSKTILHKKNIFRCSIKKACFVDDATKQTNPKYFSFTNLFHSIKAGEATGNPVAMDALNEKAQTAAQAPARRKANANLLKRPSGNSDDSNTDEVVIKEEISEDEAELEPADDFMDSNDMSYEVTEEKEPLKINDEENVIISDEKQISPDKIIGKDVDIQFEVEADDIQDNEVGKDGFAVKEFTCPICTTFKCKVTRGDLLCQHLETCVSEDGGTCNNENSSVTEKLLTCPICQQFTSLISEKINFAEHIGACQEIVGSAHDSSRDDTSTVKNIKLSSRIFQCDVCPQKRFMKLNRFICHYVHHKKMYKYECVKCPQKFTTLQLLCSHWHNVHRTKYKNIKKHSRYTRFAIVPSIPWWCSQCNEKFSTELIRDEHVKSVHFPVSDDSPQEQELQNKCSNCKNSYCSEDELKLHWNTCHLKENKFYYCEVCFEMFQDRVSVEKHRKKVHKRGLHSCSLCERKYAFKNDLEQHILALHSTDKTKIAHLTCSICNKVLSNRNAVAHHINSVHKKITRFFCQVCGRPFTEATSFKRHMARLHKIGNWKQKVFPCSVEGCIHKARSQDYLNCHMSWHRKDPQFKCIYCGKDFYFLAKLKRHEQYHTITNPEDMRYECSICLKKFFRKDLYRQHIRIHDPNRARKRNPRTNKNKNDHKEKGYIEFNCSICGLKCEGPNLLNKHKRETHPDDMRTCNYCGKVCKNELTRDQHVRIVHEKRFKVKTCEYCGKAFRNLTRHYRQMHKEHFP